MINDSYLAEHHQEFIKIIKQKIPETSDFRYDPEKDQLAGQLIVGSKAYAITYSRKDYPNPFDLERGVNIDVACLILAKKLASGEIYPSIPFFIAKSTLQTIKITVPRLDNREIEFELNSPTDSKDHIYDFNTGKLSMSMITDKIKRVAEENNLSLEEKETTRGFVFQSIETTKGTNPLDELDEDIQMPFVKLTLNEENSRGINFSLKNK